MNAWLLPLVTFFPLVGVAIILVLKKDQQNAARWVALATSLATLVISLVILLSFNYTDPDFQMQVAARWIEVGGISIGFQMGIDGISLLLLLLTTLLTVLAIVFSWSSIKENVNNYMLFFLLLETGMVGVFLSLDLFLFYIFWEFSLVPMYLLIGIYGGPRRMYAAVKFFLYTMAGSVLMLLAILWLGITGHNFSFPDLVGINIPPNTQIWLFLAFAIAFAIKVPMVPFHSWLPDAHVEAPTAGSVILAGVLLKMGAYGLLRFNISLFPQAAIKLAPYMALLAVIGIIYGAAVSFAQQDMKKLVAYSSISHMGFIVLGMFALNNLGIQGSVLQMVNHGISTGALFLIVGMIYDRRHTRDMDQFGGLWTRMPVYGTLALIVSLSSMALPGLNGFVGEFTILLGAFNSSFLGGPWFAGVAALGVILAAVYILTMFQKVFLGPLTSEANRSLNDIHWQEIAVLVPLLVFIFWIGLYPKPFFGLIGPATDKLVSMLQVAAASIH
jgi:NADH-quinone oxidoreductase subunit M